MSDPISVPRWPFWLGWAGVLPFAALTAAALLGIGLPGLEAERALVAYGACILSFLGGAQWGLLVPQDQRHRTIPWRYGVSVLPSLAGFACLLIASPASLYGLIAGFLALCAYDLSTVRRGLAPAWYGSLRMQLTGAVVALLLVAALA